MAKYFPSPWHLLAASSSCFIHHNALSGFSFIRLKTWDLGFNIHKSQFPCIVLPFMLGSPKSKVWFAQKLPTSFDETPIKTRGIQTVSYFFSGCGLALNLATRLGSSALMPINESHSVHPSDFKCRCIVLVFIWLEQYLALPFGKAGKYQFITASNGSPFLLAVL